jgi:hypothetical protein
MNWGPETSRRTQPTGHGGKKRSFARSNPAKHFESPIRRVADRTAVRSSAAYPLETLVTDRFEFRFVLDSGGMIPLIRTANEKRLEHRQLSLLWQRPKGVPGERSHGPLAELFEGVETGRSEAPRCLFEPGRGPHSLPVGIRSFAHSAGSSKLLGMLPTTSPSDGLLCPLDCGTGTRCWPNSNRSPFPQTGHGVFEVAGAPGRGSAVRAILPIAERLAGARLVGPGVAAGERLSGANNAIRDQRSELTWQKI